MKIIKINERGANTINDFNNNLSGERTVPHLSLKNESCGNEVSMYHLKREIHAEILKKIDLRNNCLEAHDTRLIREKAERELDLIVQSKGMNENVGRQIKLEILEEIFGLGPLQALLDAREISEIMVNGYQSVYVEKQGKLIETDLKFISNKTLLSIIERIINAVNRRIDESVPFVDARLSDGSRVNAVIPPVSLTGSCLTIRKFAKNIMTAEELISLGSFGKDAVAFLEHAVKKRANIIIGGGTGSGKTTLLNVLSTFIPDNERIVTIEDAAELKLQNPHVISLEGRPANLEGKGEITIRNLVRNTLRMRPDRLIIGECRGEETLDMLQAMNTGHDGSMTTAHANSPRDLLARIETMVLFSGLDLPLRAIREQVASAIDLIIYIARFGCGARKVTSITEINGISDISIMTQDIFTFDKNIKALVKTGIRSKFGEVGK